MTEEIATAYHYDVAEASHTHAYLWKPVERLLAGTERIFDLGCGNGALVRHLKRSGFNVMGVDPSETGVALGRQADPSSRLEVGNAYEDLAARYGTFSAVVSLEVIEPGYYSRKYAKCIFDLLQPGGQAIISTPYHYVLRISR